MRTDQNVSTFFLKHRNSTPSLLMANLSLLQVSVVFNKIVESVDQPYIKLVVSELGAQVSVLECEMRLGAKLGSVHLIDFLFKGFVFVFWFFCFFFFVFFSFIYLVYYCRQLSI